MAAAEPAVDSPRPPLQWAEFALVALLVLLGGGLRFAYPERIAVEHFDEGVYASDLWFAGGTYPLRHLYAPPLLPRLIECSLLLWGPGTAAAMMPNLLAGTLLIGGIWWVARGWFGREAGLASACLAAFSDLHILYSRTALTDGLLCFGLLAAVYCFGEAFRRASFRWAALAGLTTAIAWWTKYTGWLPLAIGLAALVAWTILENRNNIRLGRLAACWLLAASTAILLWSPVLLGLQEHGGYAAVAANHRRYLVGWAGWDEALLRQLANLRSLEGGLSVAGLGVAWLLPLGLHRLRREGRFTWNGALLGTGLLLLLLGGAAAFSAAVVIAILAGLGLSAKLKDRLFSAHSIRGDASCGPAVWLPAVWFVGLLIATPFYHPYPRLTLPWLVAAWLAAGAGVSAVVSFGETGNQADRRWRCLAGIAAVVGLLLGGTNFAQVDWRRVPGWQDRTELSRIGRQVVSAANKSVEQTPLRPDARPPGLPEFVFYVYGEPALVYHLSVEAWQAGSPWVARPVGDLAFAKPQNRSLPVPTFLVIGVDRRNELPASQWNRAAGNLGRIAAFPYRPSRLVLLNHCSPQELAEGEDCRNQKIELYRLRPQP